MPAPLYAVLLGKRRMPILERPGDEPRVSMAPSAPCVAPHLCLGEVLRLEVRRVREHARKAWRIDVTLSHGVERHKAPLAGGPSLHRH
jgi:hypothetical protein